MFTGPTSVLRSSAVCATMLNVNSLPKIRGGNAIEMEVSLDPARIDLKVGLCLPCW